MSASQISQIESGRRKDPGFSTIVRLAKAIGVSLDVLAGLREPKEPSGLRLSSKAKSELQKAQHEALKVSARIVKALNESN